MNQSTRRAAAVRLAGAAALLGAVAAGDPQTYKVQLDRPVKVGQRFAVTGTAEVVERVKWTSGRKSQTNEGAYSAELAGVAQVEAVAAKVGLPSKLTLTIAKLTQDGAEVLPRGTVVTVDHTTANTTFTTADDGKPLDPAKAAVIGILLDVEAGDRAVSDDAMFGTAQPQPVGGTWAGDAGKVTDLLAGANLPFARDGLTASAKLAAVKPVDGRPAAVVETTIAADHVKPNVKLPDGMTIAAGSVRGTVTYTLPADAALPAAVTDEHTTLDLTLTGQAPDGRKVDESTFTERTIHRTMTPKP